MRVYTITFIFLLGLSNCFGQSDFDNAQKLSSQHAYASSSSILVQYIQDHPQRKYDLARAWWLHSFNLLKLGSIAEALEANETSLSLRKDLRSTDAAYNYLRYAEIQMAANNYESALDNALQGMQFMIEDAALYARLNMACAKALVAMKLNKEAQEYMQTTLDIVAIELSKKHELYSRFAFDAGFLSIQSKKFESAHHYFRQAYIFSNDPILSSKAFFFAIANY